MGDKVERSRYPQIYSTPIVFGCKNMLKILYYHANCQVWWGCRLHTLPGQPKIWSFCLSVCVCLSVVLLLAKFFAQKLQKFVFFQCNFFDHRGLKVVYRRYSAFCFITGITDDEVRLYVHHYIFIATVLMFILKSVDICRVLPHVNCFYTTDMI